MKIPEEPTGNLPMQISEKITDFHENVRRQIEGGSQDYPFQKEWNRLAVEFRGILAESEPILTMSDLDRGVEPSRLNAPKVYMTIDDDDEDMVESPSTKKRRNNTPTQATPRKKPTVTPKSVTQRALLNQIPPFDPYTITNCDRPFAHRFSLDDLRSIIQDAHIGLPGQTDPRAIERVISLSMGSWDQPLGRFMEKSEELCLGMIRSHLNKSFELWHKTPLHNKLHNICEEFVKDKMKVQIQAAERARLLELQKPMTFNKEAVELAYAKGRKKAEQGRQYFRAKDFVEQHMKESSQNLTLDEKITKVIDAKRLGPDEYQKEVEIIGVSSKCQIRCEILALVLTTC